MKRRNESARLLLSETRVRGKSGLSAIADGHQAQNRALLCGRVGGARRRKPKIVGQNLKISHTTRRYLFVEAIDYVSIHSTPMHAQSPPKPYARRASTQNRSGAEAQQDLIGAHVDTTAAATCHTYVDTAAAAACSLGGWDGALFRRKRRKKTKSPEQQLGQKIENVPSRAIIVPPNALWPSCA